jgi:hypothetical protein
MNKGTQDSWLKHEGDEILTFLHTVEEGLVRAIHGIWLFIWLKIPELARLLFSWLQVQCIYVFRIALRVARIAGIFIAWALIVFGPVAIYAGILTGLWSALAFGASIWGVQRQLKKHQRVWAAWKERIHA